MILLKQIFRDGYFPLNFETWKKTKQYSDFLPKVLRNLE